MRNRLVLDVLDGVVVEAVVLLATSPFIHPSVMLHLATCTETSARIAQHSPSRGTHLMSISPPLLGAAASS